jgi:hypothetical protein
MHSETFVADVDHGKKNYNIHIAAEFDFDPANDDAPTSKGLLKVFEDVLESIDMTPVAAQCLTDDGEFTTEVWVDDEPVSFHELIAAYKRQEAFLDREDRVELFQRTDMLWDWRVIANNGNVISTSGGQGYNNRGDAAVMIYSLFGPLDLTVINLHTAPQPALWNGEGTITLDVPQVAKGEEDE